jgi:hypothetical protein
MNYYNQINFLMNKDTSLSSQARRLLFISDETLETLVRESQQQYFVPDGEQNFNVTLDYFKCFSCKRIPLNLQECKGCKEVVCEGC